MPDEVMIVEKELSYLIMQAAYEVFNQLGPGFPEAIYDEALASSCSIALSTNGSFWS
jgi:hypothetical protein